MHVVASVLASQGALSVVEWFVDVPRWAERLILMGTACVVSAGLMIWRNKHEG